MLSIEKAADCRCSNQDRQDHSAALATLLRGNLVARAHIPGKATRLRKDQLRQRLYGRGCAHEFAIGCTPCLIARTILVCHNAAISLAAAA